MRKLTDEERRKFAARIRASIDQNVAGCIDWLNSDDEGSNVVEQHIKKKATEKNMTLSVAVARLAVIGYQFALLTYLESTEP